MTDTALNSGTIGDDESFTSERVMLRLVRPEDCANYYVAWLEDPEVNRYLETRWVKQNLTSVNEFVANVRASDSAFLFAIIDRNASRHIGNIKIGAINRQHRVCDVSYFIGDKEYWGKGFASEAIRLAVHISFDRLGMHRVDAGVYSANVGSIRALEKAGFQLEGRLAKRLRSEDGWCDHLLFGRIRSPSD